MVAPYVEYKINTTLGTLIENKSIEFHSIFLRKMHDAKSLGATWCNLGKKSPKLRAQYNIIKWFYILSYSN